MAASKTSMCLCRLFYLSKNGLKPLINSVSNSHTSQFNVIFRNLSTRNTCHPFRSNFSPAVRFYGTVFRAKPWASCAKFFSSKKSLTDFKGLSSKTLQEQLQNDGSKSFSSSSQESADEKAKSEKEQEDKQRADAFQKKMMKFTFIAFGAMFTGMGIFLVREWGAPIQDDDGNIILDEYSELPSWKAYLYRAYREMMNYNKMIQDPSREKLLPEPLTEPYYQPPYTLVLEMKGILIHPEWTYQTGWRFKKRPGVDFFLQQVGPPLFEVVIYTSEQGMTAFPILDTLDPNGYIMYRLFRDATRYLKGHHVKDLSCLNRDLSKVILVEWDPNSFQLQPENALKIQKWSGNDDDRALLDLAMFLRTIATSGVEDVRTVLQYYFQFDDPLEAFKENQRKLAEREQRQKLSEEVRDKQALTSAFKGGLFRHR